MKRSPVARGYPADSEGAAMITGMPTKVVWAFCASCMHEHKEETFQYLFQPVNHYELYDCCGELHHQVHDSNTS